MSPYNEALVRLERLTALWRELQRTPLKSPAYEALVRKIRVESDAYNALVAAQAKDKKSSDSE
jgi:hypothetical protein